MRMLQVEIPISMAKAYFDSYKKALPSAVLATVTLEQFIADFLIDRLQEESDFIRKTFKEGLYDN